MKHICKMALYGMLSLCAVSCSSKSGREVVERWDNTNEKIVKEYADISDSSSYTQYQFYKTGSLESMLIYTYNRLNGECSKYYPNGHLSEKYTYSSGKLNGCAMAWYENSNLRSIGFFEMGRTVDRTNYYPNGQAIGELEYGEDGFLVYGVYYHENGKLRSKGAWDRNQKKGVWQKYSNNGVLIEERKY